MLKENCKAGMKVKFTTKSTGQGIETLKGTRKGVIHGGFTNNRIKVVVRIGTRNCINTLNFLPSDLEPNWEEGNNNA